MPLALKDRLYFQLIVGGKEVKFEQNSLDYVHIAESVRLKVPALSIRIKDVTKFFTKNDLLVDGVPIQVTVGVKDKKSVFYFRLFSHKESIENGVTVISMHAYLDVPRYWTESTASAINDTASNALQQLALVSGLTYSGVSTNDQQLWLPFNSKRADFAKQITLRAYMDESSCCQLAVTANKTLLLANVSNFAKQNIVQQFANAGKPGRLDGVSTITDYKIINKSGFFNTQSGYKDSHVAQSLIADDVIHKDLNVPRNSKKLMINDSVRKAVTQQRVSYAPIDVGNTNANYERAKYQNMRLSNLFSYGLEFVTGDPVTANIFDVITCDLAKPGVVGIGPISGKYMVTSKVLYIQNFNFYQKIEVFRHGLNDSRETTQA